MATEVEATVDFCRELVRLPSLSGQEKEVAEAVRARMHSLNYDHVVVDAWGNVVGTIEGGRAQPDSPKILLDAHMDTVPPGDLTGWQHDPYGAEVEQGRVYGRGAVDDKASVAAIVSMAPLLDRDHLAGTVYVCASIHEEVAEGAGLAKVIEAVRPDFVVVCEPTELKLGIGQKGRAGVRVEATGVASHSSRPSDGVNAVYKMVPAIQRLRSVETRGDPLLGEEIVELVELISTPYPSTAIVPYHCLARYDCRLVRQEPPDKFLARLQAVAGEEVSTSIQRQTITCYTDAQIEIEEHYPAWTIAPDAPFVVAARRGLQSVGHPVENCYLPYCTNASYTAGVAHIPTILYGPGSVRHAHILDEYVEIAQLTAATEGYAAIVSAVLAG